MEILSKSMDLTWMIRILSDGGRVGVNQSIDITNGNSVTFSVADNDNDSGNELQQVDQF